MSLRFIHHIYLCLYIYCLFIFNFCFSQETNAILFDAFDDLRFGSRSFGIFQCEALEQAPRSPFLCPAMFVLENICRVHVVLLISSSSLGVAFCFYIWIQVIQKQLTGGLEAMPQKSSLYSFNLKWWPWRLSPTSSIKSWICFVVGGLLASHQECHQCILAVQFNQPSKYQWNISTVDLCLGLFTKSPEISVCQEPKYSDWRNLLDWILDPQAMRCLPLAAWTLLSWFGEKSWHCKKNWKKHQETLNDFGWLTMNSNDI